MSAFPVSSSALGTCLQVLEPMWQKGLPWNVEELATLAQPEGCAQTVLVTGANRGLGFATAQHFARLGANVRYNPRGSPRCCMFAETGFPSPHMSALPSRPHCLLRGLCVRCAVSNPLPPHTHARTLFLSLSLSYPLSNTPTPTPTPTLTLSLLLPHAYTRSGLLCRLLSFGEWLATCTTERAGEEATCVNMSKVMHASLGSFAHMHAGCPSVPEKGSVCRGRRSASFRNQRCYQHNHGHCCRFCGFDRGVQSRVGAAQRKNQGGRCCSQCCRGGPYSD